jgi:hypothetical protein
MKKSILLALGLMALMAGSAAADSASACNGELLKHPSKVQVCVPTGWTHEVKDGSLRIKNKKDWTVQIRLEPVDAADAEGALKKLDAKMSDFVTVDWGKPKEIKASDKENPNRMDGVVISGAGKRKDNKSDIQALAAIVVTPVKSVLLVSLIGDKAYLEKDGASVIQILNTIQPTP